MGRDVSIEPARLEAARRRVEAVARVGRSLTIRQIEYDLVLAGHPSLARYVCSWRPGAKR